MKLINGKIRKRFRSIKTYVYNSYSQYRSSRYSRKCFYYNSKSISFSLFTVNPEDIESIQAGPINTNGFDERGRLPEKGFHVNSSDWYVHTMPIKETFLYKGFYQHFIDKVEWSNTVLHPDNYKQLHPTLPRKYIHYSVDEFLKRGDFIDSLYSNIKSRYSNFIERDDYYFNEMGINLGPSNELIHNSCGFHRLIVCQLLGITEIPVRILTVHPDSSWITQSLLMNNALPYTNQLNL